MYTITLVNQKGGSGKSTLAECLAVAAYLDGKAVAVLDMDPQGSIYAWKKRRSESDPIVLSVQPANVEDEWQRVRDAGADFVFIDTPARLNDWAMKAAELADLVIVPSKATIKDLERVTASIKLVNAAEVRPTVVVLNQVRPQLERSQEAEEFIRRHSIPVCPGRIGHRVAFEDSDTLGQTPQETEPKGKAADEIAAVYRYVRKLVRESTRAQVDNPTRRKAGAQ